MDGNRRGELAPPMPSRPGAPLGSVLFLPGFLSVESLPEFLQEGRAASGPWPFLGKEGKKKMGRGEVTIFLPGAEAPSLSSSEPH